MKRLAGILFVLVLIAYFGWSYITSSHGDQAVAYNPADRECYSSDDISWRYCIHRAKQGTNDGIAYLLHGRNLDEKTWNDDTFYTSMLQNYWSESNVKPPIVVTVSFGPVWLLTPKGKATKSGLLQSFIDKVIPTVESKIGQPSYRAVFGESMGGLNALIVGLRSPQLFRKVAALCPGVYKDASPYSSISKMSETIKRTGAEPLVIYGIISLAKDYVSDEAEWNDIAPIEILKSMTAPKSTEYYLSADLYDKYGNFEGSQELSRIAKQKNFKIQWRPIYGGHCAVDITSLGDFLL